MTTGQLIIVLLMGATTALNYLRYRDLLYPPVVHGSMWTGVLLLYLLNQEQLVPLSPLFYTVVLSGLITFSIGSYLTTRKHTVRKVRLSRIPFTPKSWYMRLLFWVPLLGLIPFLLRAYALGQEGPFDSFYMNLRFAATNPARQSAGGAFGLSAYLLPVSYASVLLQTLLARYREHPLRYGISVGIALTYALFFTGRTNVTLLLITAAGILLLTRRTSVRRVLLAGSLTFLFFFVGMGFLVGKVGAQDASLGENLQSVYDALLVYTVGSLPAFDTYMHVYEGWEGGRNMFRAFYAALARLGVDVPVEPLIQEFTFVPFPTNVYTVYRPYFDDFALWGVFLMPLLLGMLHGFLYRKATEGHLFFILAYALSLAPLVMQFFNEGYFTSLSLWTQYALLAFVFFYRVRLLPPPAYHAHRLQPQT